MRAPIALRLKDSRTDRHVTQYADRFRFRKTAPGGYADASCELDMPADTFPTLGPADRIFAYDKRTGRTLWEGYTNNPGTKTGREGQGFELSALGAMVRASDESRAMLYVDDGPANWAPLRATAPGASIGQFDEAASTEAGTGGFTGWQTQFPGGQPILPNSAAGIMYYTPLNIGSDIAAFRVRLIGGKVDAGYRQAFLYNGTGGSGTVVMQTSISTSGSTNTRVAGVDFAIGTDRLHIVLQRTGGATNIADDTTWTQFQRLLVVGHRYDKSGALVTPSATMTVLASDVVEDLVGRLMPFVDKATAQVDATTWPIDQLAYLDGARASQVLEDLGLWEPDYLWEILESNASGLFRFNYRAWPTTPRYLIPPSIPVEQPGGDVDLCNRISVYWTDPTGKPQVTTVTTSVAELGGAPGDPGARTRDADPITLPDGFGSLANAQRIGGQVLATKANPPSAATVTVDRPIRDVLRNMDVWPWEIEPGYPAQVMATGDDVRITEMEYNDDSCSSTLTLGDPVLTIEQRVARLSKVAKK